MNTDHAISTLKLADSRGIENAFEQHMELLRHLLDGELERVEAELPTHLQESVYPLVETGRHLIAAGGKRVRPALTLVCAHAVGRPGEDARKLAAAGELVHLATLLHDDVIDDGKVRRGVPTPRVIWSNTASVLGGDYALTRALDLVGSVDTIHPLREAIETLRLLVEGEVLQLSHRGAVTLTRAAYTDMVERKTASLFRWCCRAGAHLGDDREVVDALGEYGRALGISFQVVDDILDFTGQNENFGKELLSDLSQGKATLPVILGAERHDELAELVERVVRSAANGDASDGRVGQQHLRDAAVILRILRESGAIDEARRIAADHIGRARAALRIVPEGIHREALDRIARALLARVR